MSDLSTGRVTAGLPSLSPSVRFQNDQRAERVEKRKVMYAEMDRQRDEAASPFGNELASVWEARVGLPLHSAEISRRLTALNPSLRFERNPNFPVMQIRVADGPGESKFICGFEAEYSPEYCVTHCHIEEHVEGIGAEAKLVKVKVADGHTRGWRKVIETLIENRLITQSGAEKMFGIPNSRTYQARIRNAK